ncbi:MAG: hypothetical protein MUE34_00005, partial [Acidimicrobiales bacterium]|nr:hypothetical protein [Acidimicrobiales bacterium]
AREMALLPYASRVTTQRRSDRDRGGRADGAPPRPSGPPPGRGAAEEEIDAEDLGTEEVEA